VTRVLDVADGGECNRDDGNPGSDHRPRMDATHPDQRERTPSLGNGSGRGETPRPPLQKTAYHSPPHTAPRLGHLLTSNAATLPIYEAGERPLSEAEPRHSTQVLQQQINRSAANTRTISRKGTAPANF
jgi:hypothetical protein